MDLELFFFLDVNQKTGSETDWKSTVDYYILKKHSVKKNIQTGETNDGTCVVYNCMYLKIESCKCNCTPLKIPLLLLGHIKIRWLTDRKP